MKRSLVLLTFLYLTGLCASLYLASLSISGSSSFCELFGSDCAAVGSSAYGSLFGFSTASFGLGYFIAQLTFLCFLIISAVRNQAPLPNPAPALLLNLAACTASLAFLAILAFELRRNCIACLVVHAVNFLTLPLNYRMRKQEKKAKHRGSLLAISLLVGLCSILIVHIMDTRQELQKAEARTDAFLELALDKYDGARKFYFNREQGDAIYGEPELALYQIVLIYKDNCPHCQRARARLIELVAENYGSVYLLTINHASLSGEELKEMDIERVPAVFVDGKRASGWEIRGFMETFIENCNC